MKIEELRNIVNEAVKKAKKKKKSKDKDGGPEAIAIAGNNVENLGGYTKEEVLDFSKPLGELNVYKRQGVSNFGPYTGTSPTGDSTVDERLLSIDLKESAWAPFVKKPIVESSSVWSMLIEKLESASEDDEEVSKE